MPAKAEDFNTRLVKNAAEGLAKIAGRKVGSVAPAQHIGKMVQQAFGPQMGRGVLSGAGILGSALVQAPNIQAVPVVGEMFESMGLDGEAAGSVIEEAVDAAIKDVTQAMANGNVTGEQADAFLNQRLNELVGEKGRMRHALDKITSDPTKETVLVRRELNESTASYRYVVHATMCPLCKPRRHVRRSKDGTERGSVSYPEGITEVTVAFAMENKYTENDQPCCGATVEKLFKRARRRPMDLWECINSFPEKFEGNPDRIALRETFYLILRECSSKQMERLSRAGRQKIWADTNLVAEWLQAARRADGNVDTEKFVTNIESRAGKPEKTIQQKVVDAITGKGDEHVEKAREFVDRLTSRVRTSGRQKRVRSRIIRNILGS